MADWYCSSAAYATYTAFQGSHAYTIGDIIVPTAPAAKAKWVFRCTTSGSSTTEPSWNSNNNGTSTSGGATFTNVTGQSTYGWTAAAGDLPTLLGGGGSNRFAGGDRVYVSSDHNETQTTTSYYGAGNVASASWNVGQILSVNRAGSVPPVAADLTAGATVTVGTTGVQLIFESYFPVFHYGITYVYTGTIASAAICFHASSLKTNYLQNCQLYLNTSTTTCRIGSSNPASAILDNTTLRFGSTSQGVAPGITSYPADVTWINTPSAIAGSNFPTTLFNAQTSPAFYLVTCRGVDLSAITGTLVGNASSGTNAGSKYLFDSCKIASGVTRYSTTNVGNTRDLVELVNCYDGTNIISESYQPSGTLTTERTITLSGGATDTVGAFSHKMVSGTLIDKFVNTLNSFWMDVLYTNTGVSRTATVEIISSGTLNNDEIALYLEYEGTSSSSVASFGNSFIATPLTSAAAVTSSTATWNSSPSTPQKQKLQVTFTPQTAGRVRGQVRLGKASTTVYINPQMTIA